MVASSFSHHFDVLVCKKCTSSGLRDRPLQNFNEKMSGYVHEKYRDISRIYGIFPATLIFLETAHLV